jgi:hypothetical protein
VCADGRPIRREYLLEPEHGGKEREPKLKKPVLEATSALAA